MSLGIMGNICFNPRFPRGSAEHYSGSFFLSKVTLFFMVPAKVTFFMAPLKVTKRLATKSHIFVASFTSPLM